MATLRWKPRAKAVAQVSLTTVTAYHASTTYSLTINGKSVSVIAPAAATVTGVAAALVALWNARTEGDFAEITASNVSGAITFTADTAGVPFTVTCGVSGGTGTIDAVSTTTAATGPYHWDDANNWTGGAVPVNSDDVILEDSDGDILYGFAQTAVTLTSLTINASYTGKVGLPDYNANGYAEYRATYLAIKATTVTIGEGEGDGSQRIRWDGSSAQTTLYVKKTSTAADYPLPTMLFKGTHASNVINATRGSLGVAILAGEVATVATLRAGYIESESSDVSIWCGAGVTLTTLTHQGGNVYLGAGLTTVTKSSSGILDVASGNITTLTVQEGTVYYRGVGTIGATTIYPDAVVDFSRDPRGRTMTNCAMHERSSLLDPLGTVTFSNALTTVGKTSEITLEVGHSRSIAIS